MLNRNAEALFWVGRYMERAENHARLIDVFYHLQPDEQPDAGGSAVKWMRMVDALGSRAAFEQHYGSYGESEALRYMTLDRDNGNSLFACVQHARNNLRTMREKLPSELWDAVNAFYLWLRDEPPETLLDRSPHELFKRIKEWTALFLGITYSVMPRENEYHLLSSGRDLERAENSLRILAAVSHAAAADGTDRYPYLQAVLKSVSGFQTFRRYYPDGVSEDAIFEFLLLHPVFPRSVHFSLRELEGRLRGMELQDAGLKQAHGRLVRQTGKLSAVLSCFERDDFAGDRIGEVLRQLMEDCDRLGSAFAKTFFRLGEVSA